MDTKKLNNYVNIPREIREMRIRGEITKAQFDVYIWTRLACSAYGIARISLEDIANDVLSGCTNNYANKILIGLLSQKLIWYKNRQGRRGSFEVHHGDFITLDGTIKTLEKFFDRTKVRSQDRAQTTSQSEVKTEVADKIQKSDSEKTSPRLDGFKKIDNPFRSGDNDKENYKDKEYIDNKILPIKEFKPKNSEESRCLEIAQNLGETDMRFILAALHRCGLSKVEDAWGLVKEAADVENPRRYFNSIISGLPCFTGKC